MQFPHDAKARVHDCVGSESPETGADGQALLKKNLKNAVLILFRGKHQPLNQYATDTVSIC